MDVYLDAVFSPRILGDERIFRQEGWHIETDENGKAVIEFYNNASCKTMKVSAETLTDDGTIGMSE